MAVDLAFAWVNISRAVWRRLGDMTAQATQPKASEAQAIERLAEGVRAGSSYMAFLFCRRVNPPDMQTACEAVGMPKTIKARERTFDALADGYSVYADGRHRKLLD